MSITRIKVDAKTGLGRVTKLRRAVATALLCAAVAPATVLALDYVEPLGASTLRDTEPALFDDDLEVFPGFYPSITFSISRTDNAFRTETDEQSDTYYGLAPSLLYKTDFGRHRFQASYNGSYTSHDDFSTEDATTHRLRALLGLDVTEILDIGLQASYIDGQESRGIAGSRFVGAIPEPDEYEERAAELNATLGRRTNRLQLTGAVGISELRYTNNNQEGRDRDTDYVRGALYWNVTPVTAVFVEAAEAEIDYVNPASAPLNLDSTETSYGVGVVWIPTDITRAQFKIGNLEKDLDDPTLEDSDGTYYSGRITWAPRTYSTFDLYGSRSTEESTLPDSSFIESDLLGLQWNHGFTDQWRGRAFAELIDDQFSTGRNDDITNYGLGLAYRMLSWLDLGLNWTHTERDSDFVGVDFEEDVISFTATAARQQ